LDAAGRMSDDIPRLDIMVRSKASHHAHLLKIHHLQPKPISLAVVVEIDAF
jgi:hypothetical protein